LGWPDIDEMTFFGQRVLPLIREREQQLKSQQQQSDVLQMDSLDVTRRSSF
jgi:hypothetical protein